jgi:Chaperone of endosialidase
VGKKYPEPPDPYQTAAAQTGTNISTAQANAVLGNVNQVTPYGSLTYTESGRKFIDDQNGATYWRGPKGEIQSTAPMGTTAPTSTTQRVPVQDPRTGVTRYVTKQVTTPGGAGGPAAGWSQVKGYYVPQYTATTKLSPAQQKVLNQTQAAQLNLAGLAKQQSSFLKSYMAKPVDLSNDAVESRLFELGRRRLDPMFAEQQGTLDQKLANQGIAIGSKAYDTAIRQQGERQNDAYNQLLLSGHQQGVSDILAQRNQPINEITALLSGSQVSNPQWAPTNQPTIPTTDIAGLIEQNFQNKMGVAQQKNAMGQSVLGGLFGLGGKLIGLSDRRAKKDITRVGEVDGLPLYRFRYRNEPGSSPKHLGLMAQDVEKVKPDAVIDTGGLKLVDYGKALLEDA